METPNISERFADSIRGKTAEELKLLALQSPAVHFACFVTIKDKNNKVITPIPNVMQLKMSSAYETLKAMGVKIRIITVKPRRAGCSSFASHIVYHHGMRTPVEGISISDVTAHSKELLGKVKDYGVTDTFPWGHLRTQSASHSVEWDNGTKWSVDSAENPDAGVGGTRQCGHFSEVSKWPKTATRNDKATMASVLPSLSGNLTVVIAESTPEGATGWMYETWQTAVTLEQFIAMHAAGICPENQWVKVFSAWYEFADNRCQNPCTPQEIAHMQATLTQHETDEIEKYNLDWEQIKWRRETIESDCSGDPKKFTFYYPSDEITCWMASGSPRFDMPILCEMEEAAKISVPDVGYLLTQTSGKVTWQKQHDGSGDILVWEPPKEGLRYIVTIDPASDESQTIGADPDRHSVSVWRKGYHDAMLDRWRPAKKVARLKPPFYGDGDEVAGHGARLSRWYGNAVVSLEINYGLDILRLLKVAGVPLYKRRPFSHRVKQVVEQYGFKMGDREERNAILEGFASAIRNREVEVLCRHSIDEYKCFIILPSGRAEAASGKHDDDVLADAIAWETLPSATEFRGQVTKHIDPPDRGPGGWRQVTKGW